MDPKELIKPLAVVIGVALLLALLAVGVLWKAPGRERWLRAAMPLVLAGAFVAGYGFLFEFPKSWNAEIWKWAVVAAAVGGVLLALAEASTKWVSWAVLIVVIAVVSWIMTRRLGENRWYYVAALQGAMALSFVSLRPATRRAELWLVGPVVMWLCGVAATVVIMMWVDLSTGRMAMMVTGLAGFAVVAGIWRPVRGLANGAGNFLAMVLASLLMLGAYYMATQIPLWVFAAMGAAPVATAVGWVPALRKRPWLCVIVAALVALAILVPTVIVAAQKGGPIE